MADFNGLRWQQRFTNFENSRNQLYQLIASFQSNQYDHKLKINIIETFKFTFKLAWKTIKDFLIYQGVSDVNFPRQVIKKGFKYLIIENGECWIKILSDEDLINYEDNEEVISNLLDRIKEEYINCIDQVYNYFKLENKKLSKFGLKEEHLKMLIEVFEKYEEIEEVKIYGSRAYGNCSKVSDIDLAFYAKSSKELKEELEKDLDNLPIPYLFDITDYNHIKFKPLKDNIDLVGKTIYKKGHKGYKSIFDFISEII
jgi:nucleotidyltransferase substrate binding protein (TIGR01987 family)